VSALPPDHPHIAEVPTRPDFASGKSQAFASLMLVLTTMLWGVSFSMMKAWQDASADCPGGPLVGALTIIALRMAASLVLLALVKPALFHRTSRQAHRVGVIVGLVCFAGFTLQAWGLGMTTPARSGFFTSLSSALVPLFAWVAFRQRVEPLTLAGLGVGVAGAGVLSMPGEGMPGGLNTGDIMTLAAISFFAVQIIVLDRLGRTVPSEQTTVGFLAVLGGASAVLLMLMIVPTGRFEEWLRWLGGALRLPGMPLQVAGMVLTTVLAFHWMNTYQPRVSATRAALIYLLESVFSAAAAVTVGFDEPTFPLLLGGGLIVGGNLLVELPNWLRDRNGRRAG
jgi:drug/metabolite transporter (DMT)-like permease